MEKKQKISRSGSEKNSGWTSGQTEKWKNRGYFIGPSLEQRETLSKAFKKCPAVTRENNRLETLVNLCLW